MFHILSILIFSSFLVFVNASTDYSNKIAPSDVLVDTIMVSNALGSGAIYLWSDDGKAYLRIEPSTKNIFICGGDFDVLQNGFKYEEPKLITSDNSLHYCSLLSASTTFQIVNWSHYSAGEKFDTTKDFTLVHDGYYNSSYSTKSFAYIAKVITPDTATDSNISSLATINMRKGWNLLGTASKLDKSTFDKDCIISVWVYNGEWSLYQPSEKSEFSVNAYAGFWINSKSSICSIEY